MCFIYFAAKVYIVYEDPCKFLFSRKKAWFGFYACWHLQCGSVKDKPADISCTFMFEKIFFFFLLRKAGDYGTSCKNLLFISILGFHLKMVQNQIIIDVWNKFCMETETARFIWSFLRFSTLTMISYLLVTLNRGDPPFPNVEKIFAATTISFFLPPKTTWLMPTQFLGK